MQNHVEFCEGSIVFLLSSA